MTAARSPSSPRTKIRSAPAPRRARRSKRRRPISSAIPTRAAATCARCSPRSTALIPPGSSTATDRTRSVYIANPNNPTGTYATREEIARLHAGLRSDILLVLDHAYAEYIEGDAEDGGMALAETAPNVLVTRTFSKMFGLAAERIGWGYASTEIIAAIHRIRLPFSITIAGTAAAIAALGDTDFVEHTRAHNAV